MLDPDRHVVTSIVGVGVLELTVPVTCSGLSATPDLDHPAETWMTGVGASELAVTVI